MKDNCEKCGWPMTITAGGDEMHCGRKYYHNDYAFCLEKQNDKAQQELNAANDRIKRLEEALDTLTCVIGLTPIKGNLAALQEAFDMARTVLKAKEAKP